MVHRAFRSAVARYRFPVTHADPEAFFETDFMQDYSAAVIIEALMSIDPQYPTVSDEARRDLLTARDELLAEG